MRSLAHALALLALGLGCVRKTGDATTFAEKTDAAPAADATSDDAAPPDVAPRTVDAAVAADGPTDPDLGSSPDSARAPDLARDTAMDSAAPATDAAGALPGDAGVGQWSKLATPGIASVHALVLDQAGNLYTGSRSNTYLRLVAPPLQALSPGIFRQVPRPW